MQKEMPARPGNKCIPAACQQHACMLAKEKRSYYNSVLLYYSISSLVFINKREKKKLESLESLLMACFCPAPLERYNELNSQVN